MKINWILQRQDRACSSPIQIIYIVPLESFANFLLKKNMNTSDVGQFLFMTLKWLFIGAGLEKQYILQAHESDSQASLYHNHSAVVHNENAVSLCDENVKEAMYSQLATKGVKL